MSSKSTIVLVPGAWVTLAFYTQLSVGAKLPRSLDDDVSNLRSTLKRLVDSVEDVMVVAHSYGGLVASGAVQDHGKPVRQSQGKQDGVVMIVYMTAFVVNKGQSLIDVCGGELLPWIKCDRNYTTLAFKNPFHCHGAGVLAKSHDMLDSFVLISLFCLRGRAPRTLNS